MKINMRVSKQKILSEADMAMKTNVEEQEDFENKPWREWTIKPSGFRKHL
jgi:hypothetical protein